MIIFKCERENHYLLPVWVWLIWYQCHLYLKKLLELKCWACAKAIWRTLWNRWTVDLDGRYKHAQMCPQYWQECFVKSWGAKLIWLTKSVSRWAWKWLVRHVMDKCLPRTTGWEKWSDKDSKPSVWYIWCMGCWCGVWELVSVGSVQCCAWGCGSVVCSTVALCEGWGAIMRRSSILMMSSLLKWSFFLRMTRSLTWCCLLSVTSLQLWLSNILILLPGCVLLSLCVPNCSWSCCCYYFSPPPSFIFLLFLINPYIFHP